MAANGHTVRLMSLDRRCRDASSFVTANGFNHERFPQGFAHSFILRRIGFSPAMRRALMSPGIDVLHTHGLWMMPNVYPAAAARARSIPFILSPRGMLGAEALRFSPLKKSVFWHFLQGRAVRAVACFHATAEQEYQEIRQYGLVQPVAILPNGIDLPYSDKDCDKPRKTESRPYVISLGRIHPKKGLDRLIKAWSYIEPMFPEWDLRIVGPSELGHRDDLIRLATKLRLSNVNISGPVFGAEKRHLLREAELFVLSTLNENFGLTVAESLAAGTPVISTQGAPWEGLRANNCGWWIGHGPEPMAAALRDAIALTREERKEMGARGRAWMERDFGWAGIADKMAKTYEWLRRGGESPPWVRTG